MLFIDRLYEEENGVRPLFYYRARDDCGLTEIVPYENEEVVTLSEDVRKKYPQAKLLTDLLCLPKSYGLYEIYDTYFEGKINNDEDMISNIVEGLLKEKGWCYIVKIGKTFGWFKVLNNKVVSLGEIQFSEVVSRYTIGRFVKRLRYRIVESDMNVSKVKFFVWDDSDITPYIEAYYENPNQMKSSLNKINGLLNLDRQAIFLRLSNTLRLVHYTAKDFIESLAVNELVEGVDEAGDLLFVDTFYKDYSLCKVEKGVNKGITKYSLIIDCEGIKNSDGSLTNGFSEVGVLLFGHTADGLIVVDNMTTDDKLLNDSFIQFFDDYRAELGYHDIINVYTFGRSDEKMISVGLKYTIKKRLKFIDIQGNIVKYLDSNNICIDKSRVLTNIAESLGVKAIYPKHTAINDARTLFNVVSELCLKGALRNV